MTDWRKDVETVREELPFDRGITYHPEHSHIKAHAALASLQTAFEAMERERDQWAKELAAQNEMVEKARRQRDEMTDRAEAAERERNEWIALEGEANERAKTAERERDAIHERLRLYLADHDAHVGSFVILVEAAERRVEELLKEVVRRDVRIKELEAALREIAACMDHGSAALLAAIARRALGKK